MNNRPRIRVEPGTGELVEEYSFDPRINEHKPVAGASYSVLLSLCSTTQALIRFITTNIFGRFLSEATMRPRTPGGAPQEGAARRHGGGGERAEVA